MTDQEYDHLDLAVARVEIAGGDVAIKLTGTGIPTVLDVHRERWERFRPSVNAAHAWPIIEEHWPAIVSQLRRDLGDGWGNLIGHDAPLLATFMRTYVAIRS